MRGKFVNRRLYALAILAGLLALACKITIPWPPSTPPSTQPPPPTPVPSEPPAPPSPPATLPPATPAGCAIDGLPGPALPDHQGQFGAEVNAAMHELRPDCDVGGTCLLVEDQQTWLAKVAAKLREKALCAGQHEPGVTDELAVSKSATDPREGWHVFAGDDAPGPAAPGARRTIVWAPQAYRGAYAAPTPAPTAPPSVYACPDPDPGSEYYVPVCVTGGRWAIHPHTMGRKDATWVCSIWYTDEHPEWKPRAHEYCAAAGYTDGRSECALRPDGHRDRVACERRLFGGNPLWQTDGQLDLNPENPWQAGCQDCSYLRVCWADGSHCAEAM